MKEEYDELLKTGMFWEFYPKFTGEWAKDKKEFSKIVRKLNKQRLVAHFQFNMDKTNKATNP